MNRRFWSAVTAAGVILLAAAVGLTLWNVQTDLKAAQSRDTILLQLADAMPEEDEPAADKPPATEPPATESPATESPAPKSPSTEEVLPSVPIDGRNYMGAIRFPSLNLELPVLAEYTLPALRIAPAVYSGTPEGNDLVICAHNYRSHFGQLNRLSLGDEVLMRTVDGAVYRYTVAATEVVSPLAVQDVTGGQWDLTLFTCTLGGRTRFVVRCDRMA